MLKGFIAQRKPGNASKREKQRQTERRENNGREKGGNWVINVKKYEKFKEEMEQQNKERGTGCRNGKY